LYLKNNSPPSPASLSSSTSSSKTQVSKFRDKQSVPNDFRGNQLSKAKITELEITSEKGAKTKNGDPLITCTISLENAENLTGRWIVHVHRDGIGGKSWNIRPINNSNSEKRGFDNTDALAALLEPRLRADLDRGRVDRG